MSENDQNATKKMADDGAEETVEKKKKKDKKKKDDKKEEQTAEGEPGAEDDDEKKEKKKKKKEKKEKKEKAAADEEEAVADEDEEKKEKKKKKKEKKEKKQQEEEEEQATREGETADGEATTAKDENSKNQVQDDIEDCDFLIIDFSQETNEKKTVWNIESRMEKVISDIIKVIPQKKTTDDAVNKQIDLINVSGHQPFNYEFMLKRIADQISEPSTKTAFKLIEPKCARTATKSSWVNFGKQAEAMGRDPQHVLGFFKSELGCNGTIGTDDMLILNGGYQQKHFIKIIKKYIEVYVKCDVCGNYQSEIKKDIKTRLESLICIHCGASRTVPPITKTFEARRRGERRRDRQ